MADDLSGDLEAWGATPPPEPDPVFARRLEADLRSQAYFASNAPEQRPGPRRRPLLRPGLVVLSAIVLLAGAVLFLRDDDPDQLIMSEAIGTQVVVPDETPVAGSPGLALPDGTRVTVDAGGSAVIDGIVLGGGTEALIIDGRIEVLITEPAPTAEPTVQLTPATTATPAPTPEATIAARPTPDPTATPGVEPSPTAAPTVRPSATPDGDRPQPGPTDQPRPSPTATAAPPADVDVSLDIERLGVNRARLTWSLSVADGVAGFEVVLTVGDRSRSIAVLRDPATRELEVEVPDAESATFAVRARAAGGAVLGQSPPVGVPPVGD